MDITRATICLNVQLFESNNFDLRYEILLRMETKWCIRTNFTDRYQKNGESGEWTKSKVVWGLKSSTKDNTTHFVDTHGPKRLKWARADLLDIFKSDSVPPYINVDGRESIETHAKINAKIKKMCAKCYERFAFVCLIVQFINVNKEYVKKSFWDYNIIFVIKLW